MLRQNLPPYIKSEYPFSSNYLQLECGNMHYIDEGTGTPVLMVHGNPTWSFYYRNLIKTLKNDFRCIVPDHIGCGLSDKPQHYQYTLSNHIENLTSLITKLNLQEFHLVVHDWGGAIGLGLLKDFSHKIKKVTILNTAAFHLNRIPLRIQICRCPLLGKLLVRGFNAFSGLATYMAVKKPLNPSIKKGYTYPYNNWKNRIATHEFVKDIPITPYHISYNKLKEVESHLDKLKDKQVEIHWGKHDFVFNDHFLEKWKTITPHAKVSYYPESGHYILEDASPKVLDNILSFLKS